MKVRVIILAVVIAGIAVGGYLRFTRDDSYDMLRGPERPPYDFSGMDLGEVTEDAPNVILISIDSLRADHLGCYGYERETSPVIDRMAEEGTLFEAAIASSSWTLPSHVSMFTSLCDPVHGVESSKRRYVLDHPLLAEVFQEAGYRTVGFYSGALLHPGYGFHQGFQDYVNCTSYPWAAEMELVDFVETRDESRKEARQDITNPRIFENVTKWLDERGQERFFMFIHYWDPHYDYIPPDPYDKAFDGEYTGSLDASDFEHNEGINPEMDPRDLDHLIALYDGEILWTDDWIGKLLVVLEERGILEKTLIVLTADHGEEFFEHGRKGHRKNLFDETVRVPLIFRWPGKIEEGRRIAEQVRTIDIYPTVLAAVGLNPIRNVQGTNLLPVLTGEGTVEPAPAYCELALSKNRQRAVRTGEWKLVHRVTVDEARLYDLVSDPGERKPIPPKGDQMTRMSEAWEAFGLLRVALGSEGIDDTYEPDPELMDRLRALGYVK